MLKCDEHQKVRTIPNGINKYTIFFWIKIDEFRFFEIHSYMIYNPLKLPVECRNETVETERWWRFRIMGVSRAFHLFTNL